MCRAQNEYPVLVSNYKILEHGRAKKLKRSAWVTVSKQSETSDNEDDEVANSGLICHLIQRLYHTTALLTASMALSQVSIAGP